MTLLNIDNVQPYKSVNATNTATAVPTNYAKKDLELKYFITVEEDRFYNNKNEYSH